MAEASEINLIFDDFEGLLKAGFSLTDDSFVASLSELVVSVARNDAFKQFVFEKTEWMKMLEVIFSLTSYFQNEHNIVSDVYLRLVRGIFLLCRNIFSAAVLEEGNKINARLHELHKRIVTFYKTIGIPHMKLFLNNIVLETLSNLTTLMPVYQLGDVCNIHLGLDVDPSITSDTLDIIDVITIFFHNNKASNTDNFSLVLYFNNLVTKNDNFLQYSLRSKIFKSVILEEFFLTQVLNDSFYETLVSRQDQEGDIEELLSAKDLIALKTLKKFLIHESVPSYLKSLTTTQFNLEDNYTNTILSGWIKTSTILLCSLIRYDSLELTNIMIWVFMFLENFSSEVINLFAKHKIRELTTEYIDNEITPYLDFLYDDLVNILDILSYFLQFKHCQKFLVHYKGEEKLSILLQTLQSNCYKLSVYIDKNDGKTLKLNENLKKNENYTNWVKIIDAKDNKIKSLNFPHCKSLIIEILTKLLVIEPKTLSRIEEVEKLQECYRELGVLEIALSNCGIDDNEPFIKERSIILLKHLLYNNTKNQDLVAKLEQRKEVNSESESLLEEIGYEVNIKENGTVGLKKAA